MTDSLPALRAQLTALLQARYAASAHWESVAPGRVNLIGDHTDYSGGLAMPCAINLATVARAAPAPPGSTQLRIFSVAYGESCFDAGAEAPRQNDWSDYLRGVHAGFLRRGARVPALDVVIASSVPPGGGLSSSASLELCFAALLETVCDEPMARQDRALLCQQAEHEYAGVPCGILDQFAISFATQGNALLLDCRAQSVQAVPVPDELSIAVIDSGVRHDLSDGSYAQRRGDVERAESALGRSLRDCDDSDVASLDDPTVKRRAKHVISENRRVREFAAALAGRDFLAAGQLMNASHASLADDFEVSCGEIDSLVHAARAAGALGARMTGGGFGGSVVCLVEDATRADFAAALATLHPAGHAKLRWIAASAGARAARLP